MTTTLFAPDIFSSPRPVFTPADSDIFEIVSDVLEQHYNFDKESVSSVDRLQGLEINSKNFKVKIGDKNYALKNCGPQVKIDECAVQLSITQALSKQGISLPQIINSASGLPYAINDNSRLWILSEFIEGPYFSGSNSHLSLIMNAIAGLQNSLEKLDNAKNLPLSAAALTWKETAKILEELFNRKNEWESFFPESESKVLRQESESLNHSFKAVDAYEVHAERNIVPTHIDLHPHNILMMNDQDPVIVDIDSLQRADKTQSLAFTIFKLVRQNFVQEKPQDLSAPAREFMKILGETDNKKLAMAATAEVLRRIGIIANLNMHKANRDWNKVLHLQLTALHEIPYVFGTKG